jgi:hypothetical protein
MYPWGRDLVLKCVLPSAGILVIIMANILTQMCALRKHFLEAISIYFN